MEMWILGKKEEGRIIRDEGEFCRSGRLDTHW